MLTAGARGPVRVGDVAPGGRHTATWSGGASITSIIETATGVPRRASVGKIRCGVSRSGNMEYTVDPARRCVKSCDIPAIARGAAHRSALERGPAWGRTRQTHEDAMTKTLILNGPNLNLLGQRQPEIYGAQTLADVEEACTALAADLGLSDVTCKQSNHEGALVDAIQDARGRQDAIVINPGAYSHTSIAILDALNAFDGKVVEVHISNIHQREAFRHHSHVSARADAVIAGLGTEGYLAALRWLARRG